MGKRSIKEDKNIYQLRREELNLTREKASELLEYISADRIEKIENEKSLPHPDEVLIMSKAYKAPNMCNHFCSQQCPIGQEYVPEIKEKNLTQITLEMLASLNFLNQKKDRLIEIAADGIIEKDELEDFAIIQNELEKIGTAADSLQLWINTQMIHNEIDAEKFKALRDRLSN